MRIFVVLLLILSCCPKSLADQVILKNGDRVTGAIVKKDAAKLTVKSVYFGAVTLPWDQVVSIRSDQPLTVVTGPEKKSIEGRVSSTEDGKIAVGAQSVAVADVVAMRNAEEQRAYLRMLRPRLTDLWVMTGNIGFAGASGNSRTYAFTVPVSFVRATNNDKITAHFNLIRSGATLNGVRSQTASAIRGGWGYNRNLAARIFVNTVNEYEHDRFQNLDLRAVLGGGLGYHAFKTDRGFFDVTGGGDYNHEMFTPTMTTGAVTKGLGEFYWGGNSGWKPSKRFSLTQSYRMFNDVANAGAIRQSADVGMTVMVTKFFTWNASTSDRYISDPPGGLRRNDLLYSTGIGFRLAR